MNELPQIPLSPSSKNIENILYNISKTNDDDKDIEIFWYGFKQSVKNFTRNNSLLYKNMYLRARAVGYYPIKTHAKINI